MKSLEALGHLLDVLAKAIRPAEFQDLLEDLQDEEPGEQIVADLDTNADHKLRLKRLLRACGSHDGGLDLLWRVVQLNVHHTRTIYGALENAFQAYLVEKRDRRQACQLELTTCRHEVAKLAPTLRARLYSLYIQHQRLEPKRLQEAISRAMRQAYPDRIAAQVFPSFWGEGPIRDWADLLKRTSHDPFELEEKFLDAFQESLSGVTVVDPAPVGLASLLVMVLRPPHWPATSACAAYSFRAYFCPHEDAPPDQWDRVDGKVNNQPIHAASWIADLRPLLIEAMATARVQLSSADSPLLLEVFLPRELLNVDIGELIQLQTLTGGSDPLNKYYPIVLRSSERFQFFQEGQARIFPNPLPAKWRHARRPLGAAERPCSWWHDATPASQNHSPQAERWIEEKFDVLRAKPENFALKRLANLPSCPRLRQKWLDQMIWACPAVALWWRPQARSTQAKRCGSVRFLRGEGDIPPDADQQPAVQQRDQPEPFTHPETANPLRLFHAFAATVSDGRRSPKHSRAFREMVLLIDSEERWPPPLVSLPAMERPSDPGGARKVTQDDICYG